MDAFLFNNCLSYLEKSRWFNLRKSLLLKNDVVVDDDGGGGDELEHYLDQTISSLREWKPSYRFPPINFDQSLPRVSVVVTTFNCQDLLPSCLVSLLFQSYQNIEIVIIDDCSSDGTYEVAQLFGHIFHNIICLRTEKNSGTYVAKNIGLTHVTGSYVTFQDADDISHRSRVERQLKNLLAQPGLVANACHYCRIDEHTGEVLLNRGERSRGGLISLMIHWPKVRDAVGFFDSVRVNADDEFKTRIRVVMGNNCVGELAECLYFALAREDGLTGSGHTGNNLGTSDMNAFLAPVRQRYTSSFKNWHNTKNLSQLYVEFPGLDRPFMAPVSIDPFQSIRFSTNSLVLTSGLNLEFKRFLEGRLSFLARFFSRIVVVESEGLFAGTIEPNGLLKKDDNANKISLKKLVRHSTMDRTIKELVDIAEGGALLIVDKWQQIDILSDSWMRRALYLMITSRPNSKMIVCSRAGAIYVPVDVLEVSSTKFNSASSSIKRALAIAAVQNGVELVFQ
jgi:glycosyltransferase involved in cell wall biosynthesis